MRALIKRDHHSECFMWNRVPGQPGHRPGDPWCLNYKDPHYTGDVKGGHRGTTTSWVRLRCLDPKCEAEAIVEEFGLWDLVNGEIG